jgi:glycosyltransferase involved in cell wall biosynthesis
LIVSCAALQPVKRVHLVPEVLAKLQSPFRWVHIGDGPERSRVQEAAEQMLPEGSWQLTGQLPNFEVREFYRSHPVRVLLSVSASEGEPVSMMEAISYGIPIVACDVGGVAELVTERIGIITSPDAGPGEVAVALGDALAESRFDPSVIREEWRARYEAASNYRRFADTLLALHRRPQSVAASGQR